MQASIKMPMQLDIQAKRKYNIELAILATKSHLTRKKPFPMLQRERKNKLVYSNL